MERHTFPNHAFRAILCGALANASFLGFGYLNNMNPVANHWAWFVATLCASFFLAVPGITRQGWQHRLPRALECAFVGVVLLSLASNIVRVHWEGPPPWPDFPVLYLTAEVLILWLAVLIVPTGVGQWIRRIYCPIVGGALVLFLLALEPSWWSATFPPYAPLAFLIAGPVFALCAWGFIDPAVKRIEHCGASSH